MVKRWETAPLCYIKQSLDKVDEKEMWHYTFPAACPPKHKVRALVILVYSLECLRVAEKKSSIFQGMSKDVPIWLVTWWWETWF